MDKLVVSASGYPADLDLVRRLENAYAEPLKAFTGVIGDDCIINGVEDDGTTISAGNIIYNGEVLPFKSGASQSRFKIVSNVITGFYDGNANPLPVYEERWAEPSSNDADPELSNLVRIIPIVNSQSTRIYGQATTSKAAGSSTSDQAFYGDITNFERLIHSVFGVYFKVHFDPIGFDYVPIVVNSIGNNTDAYQQFTINNIGSSSFTIWPENLSDDDGFAANYQIQIVK